MSEISNCIKMAYILKRQDRIIKIAELAKILEVKPRTIRKYRDDLEKAGIYIDSIRGKNGGYRISANTSFIGFYITEEERKVLQDAFLFLENCEDYVIDDELKNLISKVHPQYKIHNYTMKDEKDIKKVLQQEREKYFKMVEASIGEYKISMIYNSIRFGRRERLIHPLEVFSYRNHWFLVAYCEMRHEVTHFKFERIEHIRTLKRQNFNKKKYKLDNFITDSPLCEAYDITKCTITFSSPVALEMPRKIWAKDGHVIFKGDGQVCIEIQVADTLDLDIWLMSVSQFILDIEPKNLKDRVRKYLENAVKNIS